jgi:Flp pilus assembly protein TadG
MRAVRDELGQSIVELALSLPLLAFMLLGGADMARGYAIQLAVQNGARAGAEAAAVDRSPTEAETRARTKDEMDRTPGMDSTAAVVNVTFGQSDGSACTDPPSVLVPCFATVRVQHTFRTITPWPLLPNVFVFDRSTSMRMFATP